MSFILDALKKSEAERQRQTGPALLEMRIVRPARRLPLWASVVGALLIVNVAVLAWLAWRAGPTRPSATLPLAAALPPAATPSSVAPSVSAAAVIVPPVVASVAGTPPSDEAADNPADLEPALTPAVAASVATSVATPGSGSTRHGLHNYAEMSGKLPELRLDLHVYATRTQDRYAFINMHKVREGETTPDGIEVKEITREGVILSFHDTDFLLGRQ